MTAYHLGMVAESPVAWAALVVSVLTLGLGALAYITTDRRVARIESERRREEVEARSAAVVSVRLVEEEVRGSPLAVRHFLVLTNTGLATAQGVTLEFLPDETYTLLRPAEKQRLPVDLQPGQEYPIQR